MTRESALARMTWRGRGPLRGHDCALGLLLAVAPLGVACAQSQTDASDRNTPIDQSLSEHAKGHGDISIAWQQSLANGLLGHNKSDRQDVGDEVRSRGLELDFDYYFADNWSLTGGIPFIDNRYRGTDPHCPTTAPPVCAADGEPVLNPQHPESQFLDDGNYHGALQNWDLGVAWHRKFHYDYYLTAALTYYHPSHDYTFFANAAVGQDLSRIELAAELAHQFQFTNWYYRAGLGFDKQQHTLGIDTDYVRADAELGYFVNPELSLRVFADGKLLSHGLPADRWAHLAGPDFTNVYYYEHDKILEHNYVGAGLGFDYRLDDKYVLSGGVQTLVWGQTVFDFRYALETRLTRSF